MRTVKIMATVLLLLAAAALIWVTGNRAEYAHTTVSASADAQDLLPSALTGAPQPTAADVSPAPTPLIMPTPEPEPQYVSLLFAGDVMAHAKQLRCHKFGSMYDFTRDYQYIKDIVCAADIALVNLETPLSGKKPYTGYPYFNAPDSLADALDDTGFDIVATANNHIRDQKDGAMKRTCAFLKSQGFEVIGTAGESGESKYALVERSGIKIGFVNFAKSLNTGFPKASRPYVNCLKVDGGYDEGYRAIGEEIAALKAMGAEFIVAFMHWGREYELQGNAIQREMAENIADMGADLIVGSHPHVLQNVAEYTSPVTGRNTLIYYSLGNLVSNQPYRYGPGRGHCETGALALIRLVKRGDGSVAIDTAGYLTTYVHKPKVSVKYSDGKKTRSKSTTAYDIVPAAAAAANPELFEKADGTLLKRIRQGVKNGEDIIGKSGEKLTLFDFAEYTDFPW